jgi:hypothetical protein
MKFTIIAFLLLSGTPMSGPTLSGSVVSGTALSGTPSLRTQVIPMKPAGQQLKDFYYGMQVESHWIAGTHIDWKTGDPNEPGATTGIHTHCSAFVAAACYRLNIYILRPPEHGQVLLANAQYDWLQTQAAGDSGWEALDGATRYEEAQKRANEGFVVVVICQNPDPKAPGHAALVLPGERTLDDLTATGPWVIMAGTHNHNKISLKAGFGSHLSGWPEDNVKFYCHRH